MSGSKIQTWLGVAMLVGVGSAYAQKADVPARSVQRAAGAVRLSHHAVGFDGRDGEGLWLSHATTGYDLDQGELLATRPPYPANTADDVARPGFSVGWSTRPIIGGVTEWNAYPYATDAAGYGAYGAEDAVALVRVGPYVVPVDPWTPVSQEGSRETREVRQRLERGRQEWLRERGFVGQVRTFVNDTAAMPARTAGAERPLARFAGVTSTSAAGADRATADTDQTKGTEKVEPKPEAKGVTTTGEANGEARSTEAPGASAVIHLNDAPVTRISLPHVAGLRNSGVRVIHTDAPAKQDAKTVENSSGE